MTSRTLRFTRQAERTLGDIASWTIDTFGPRQAAAYRDELIACCAELAAGTAPSKSCRALVERSLPEDLRFVRAGQHFIVFIETPATVIVLDFLHVRSNLPARIADLSRPRD